MDPITGAVVAIVLWAVLLFACWSLPTLLALVGGFFGSLTDSYWDDSGMTVGAGLGAILGWLAAIGLTIVSLIQIILQTIHLIQLLN